jgi:hypothetical protein
MTTKKGAKAVVGTKQSTPPRDKQARPRVVKEESPDNKKEEEEKDLTISGVKKETKEFFTIGEWKGFTQYRCNFCPFDTLHERLILSHLASKHIPEVRMQDTGLVDESGRSIVKEV